LVMTGCPDHSWSGSENLKLSPPKTPGGKIARMAVPPNIRAAVGSWKGKSKLNLPWLPADKQVTESDSQLHVDTDDRGTIATLTYDWHYEGKRHEGTMILAGSTKEKKIEIAVLGRDW
jgi:hypothetical protein